MTIRWLIAVLVLAVPMALSARAEEGKTVARLTILVPAYFYPAGPGLKHWDNMIASAGRVPIVAIVNPGSGPGKEVDANYTAVARRAHKAGIRLIGYVSTSYAKRPLAEAKADIDTWLKFYPEITGFFFDEQASAADKADHYAALFQHARKTFPKAHVFSNPGTICAVDYLKRPCTNVACLHESAGAFGPFQLPPWAEAYPANAFAALVYKTPGTDNMTAVLRDAVKKKVGYFLVTDGDGANPWDRLPSYWDEEVRAIQTINAKKTPE